MSRLVIVFSVIATLIGAGVANAQPVSTLNTEVKNFGQAAPFEKLRHDIVITNEGDKPLVIEDVKTTCGCTAAIASVTTVPAGGESIIHVTMTASSSTTRMSKQVQIATNDPKAPKQNVTLIADVRNAWLLSPTSSFRVNDVPFGQEESQTLVLSNKDGQDFKIIETRADRPEFRIEVGERTDNGVPITLYAKGGDKRETITSHIEIITDYKEQPVTRVNAMATITGLVKFTPTTLYFGRAPAGKTVERELRLHLTDESKMNDFSITKIEGDGSVKGEVLGVNPLGQMRVKVSYDVPEEPGYHRGTITLHTTLKEEPTVEIPYSALVPKTN